MTPVTDNADRRPDPEAEFSRLLDQARAGDRQALERLFERFYPRVEQQVHVALAKDLRRSRPWLSTRFSTGDIVQEVFRSVLRDLDEFQGRDEPSFLKYLSTLVRNRLLDVVRFHEADRRDGRRTRPREDEEKSPDDGPSTDAVLAEQRAVYEEVLQTFPQRERALLRGRIEDELEFAQLQSDLGYTSVSAVRRAFYAAQAQLAIRLRQRDPGDLA